MLSQFTLSPVRERICGSGRLLCQTPEKADTKEVMQAVPHEQVAYMVKLLTFSATHPQNGSFSIEARGRMGQRLISLML